MPKINSLPFPYIGEHRGRKVKISTSEFYSRTPNLIIHASKTTLWFQHCHIIPTSEEHIDFQHEIKKQQLEATFYLLWMRIFKQKSMTINIKQTLVSHEVNFCSKLNKNVAPTQIHKTWRDQDNNKILWETKCKLNIRKSRIFLRLCKCFAAQDKQPHDKHKTKENDWKSFKSLD